MGNGRVIVGCTHGEEDPDRVVCAYLTAGAALDQGKDVLAAPLLVVAATVGTTNWCVPSLIYGLIHRREAGGATA